MKWGLSVLIVAALGAGAGLITDIVDLHHRGAVPLSILFLVVCLALVAALAVLLRRSRTDQAVAYEKAQFVSTLLDTVDVAIVSCDAKGVVQMMNSKAQEFLGVTAPSGISAEEWGTKYGMFKPGGERPMSQNEQTMIKALKGQTIVGDHVIMRTQGRPDRHMLANGKPLRDASGKITGAVIVAQDVTSLETAQAKLQAEADRLREAVSVQQVIVGNVDNLEATTAEAAAWACRLGGGDGGAFQFVEDRGLRTHHGSGSLEPLSGQHLPIEGSLSGIAVRTGITQFSNDTRADRRFNIDVPERLGIRSLVSAPVRSSGEIIGTLVVSSRNVNAFDSIAVSRIESVAVSVASAISMSKLLSENQDLFASSEIQRDLYERLLGTISDMGEGVTIGVDDTIVYSNAAFCKMSGYSESELLSLPSTLLVADDDDRSEWLRRRSAINNGQDVGRLEITMRTKSGHTLPIEITSQRIVVDGVIQRINVVRDISVRRQWEDSLAEQAEALLRTNDEMQRLQAVRADFLASVSHDFRTPLTAIVGFSGLVIDSDDSTTVGEIRSHLQRVENASAELRRRVDTFLDYSTAENGDFEIECAPTDIALVVGEVLANLAPALTGRDVAAELTANLMASVETPSLIRAVENLVTNAIKYSPDGTELLVSVLPVDHGIEIAVADRGYGIPAEDLESVFDSYFRSAGTKSQIRGSGLGLSVVRQLIEAMNGTVQVSNRAGGGSVFAIVLPFLDINAFKA